MAFAMISNLYYASWSVQKREEESRCTPINVEAMLRLLWYDIPILYIIFSCYGTIFPMAVIYIYI